MSKKGMKRPEYTHTQQRNRQESVPELLGKQHTPRKTPLLLSAELTGSTPKSIFRRGPSLRTSILLLTPIWPGTTWKTISLPLTCLNCKSLLLLGRMP